MNREELAAIAAAAGLTKLSGKHLDQLARGIASTRDLAGRLPKDLHWAEEIALVFRLPVPGSRKP